MYYSCMETLPLSVSHSIGGEGTCLPLIYKATTAYKLYCYRTFKVKQRWKAKSTVFIICNNDIVVGSIKVEQFKVVVCWLNHVNKPVNGVMVVTVN